MSEKESGVKIMATNKKAFHNYHILEKCETGIVLVGCEVKSVRSGQINLQDGFVRDKNGELWLFNCYLSPYTQASGHIPDPTRDRKLLLHKVEIVRLLRKSVTKGLTMVPLKLYLKKGRVKVEIGLAQPKKLFDKRRALKEKTVNRDISRGLRSR
ncbi:MAG: SsrA-binding protein SmpB [Candidatus Margulisbacteria bacterium]|nr:SsrA-binding protein SmpB [Candidatus Margulisiibacteriota bacterium]